MKTDGGWVVPDKTYSYNLLDSYVQEKDSSLLAQSSNGRLIILVKKDKHFSVLSFEHLAEATLFFGYLKGNWQQSLE